jgi:hypothetical protein
MKDYDSALDEKAEVKLHRDVREKIKIKSWINQTYVNPDECDDRQDLRRLIRTCLACEKRAVLMREI